MTVSMHAYGKNNRTDYRANSVSKKAEFPTVTKEKGSRPAKYSYF